MNVPWPAYAPDEIEAVQRVLRSGKVNYWTGEEARLFEQEFAQAMGCEYGVALANGTVALELALISLGIGLGHEVVVTPRTFVASASCIAMCGARPVFADVDPESQNITAQSIEAVLTDRTRAVLCVHLNGWACEMDAITELAARKGLWVIEDCAQAHGAAYKEQPVGSWGHVAAWSFCQDKIMTTGGEGGMLTTNEAQIWSRAWEYKDHGKSWAAVQAPKTSPGFQWLHNSWGTNWRMTEMQAAIGRVQLGKLKAWSEQRRRNARRLEDGLGQIPALRLPQPPVEVEHAFYKFYLFVRPERLRPGWERDRIMGAINAQGVPCMSGICPEVYLEQAFQEAGLGPKERLPKAKELGQTSLMLMVYPTLTEQDMDRVSATVREVMIMASE